MSLLLSSILFILIATASYFSVGWMHRWLLARQILDIPNQRSTHVTPTPRGGGLVVVILVLLSALVSTLSTQNWRQGLVVIGAGLLIAILGWIDDVHTLSARVRIFFQAVAALACIIGLGFFQSVQIPLLGELHLGWLGIPVTLLWIVGLTNAFNFMDGIDGITGGVAAAAGLGWIVLSVMSGALHNDLAYCIALALTASCIGFLGHNWHPAHIFIGDVCSTFLGYIFAVLPLLSAKSGGDALLVGTIILWVYILDTGLTFLRRLFQGEHVFSPHRTHLYQRLVISGLVVPKVSGLYILLSLMGSALAVGWMMRLPFVPVLILPGLPLAWAELTWYTQRVRKA